MKIRPAVPEDLSHIRQLYFDTITNINIKDYSREQISEWASFSKDIVGWEKRFSEQYFFIAELNGKITGFSSVTDNGYVDFMFVHKDFQRQGIASELLNAVEQIANNLKLPEITADVSITARPFFLSNGFEITRLYTKTVNGIKFDDCFMTKILHNK